ncbi:MAG: glycosyltransferase [Proteobacteria bacterium]|nr:glycosyltransferase [Pseudomonadota bacterium]
MTNSDLPFLSVVLPSYEGVEHLRKNVPSLREYLEKLGISHEIIVVDDGSKDKTETQEAASEAGCRFLENPRNLGKGAAVRRGMLAARGKYRIYTDIDIPYEFSAIETILHFLECKDYHFVAGDRKLEESGYYLEVSSLRKVSSHVFSTIVGRFIASGWFDTQCGLKGFRDNVAKDLFSVARIDRFAFDVELFYIALKRNYDIKRIPVVLRCNSASTVRILHDSAEMVRDLGAIRINQLLGRYNPQEPVVRYIEPERNACQKHIK